MCQRSHFANDDPVIIIGGILSGFFTPTEASVVATLYALVLGLFVYREYALKDLPKILWEALNIRSDYVYYFRLRVFWLVYDSSTGRRSR